MTGFTNYTLKKKYFILAVMKISELIGLVHELHYTVLSSNSNFVRFNSCCLLLSPSFFLVALLLLLLRLLFRYEFNSSIVVDMFLVIILT